MRASLPQIRAALRHPSEPVRLFALRYFAESLQPDPEAALIGWQTLDSFEPGDAGWQVWSLVNDLPHTPASLEYFLANSKRLAPKWNDRGIVRAPTFANTSPQVLAPFIEDIFGPIPDDNDLLSAQQRVLALAWSRDDCLQNIEMLIDGMEGGDDIQYLREAAEALARDPQAARNFALPLLPRHLSAEDGEADADGGWREIVAIAVAGYARLEEAIPHLVAKLAGEGGEYVWEESMYALTRIGTQAAIDAVICAWSGDGENAHSGEVKFYAVGVLEDVHIGQGLAAYHELFTSELDDSFRTALARAMLAQFDTDGFSAAHELIRRGDWDPMIDDPRVALAAVQAALGIDPEESRRLLEQVGEERARNKRLREARAANPKALEEHLRALTAYGQMTRPKPPKGKARYR